MMSIRAKALSEINQGFHGSIGDLADSVGASKATIKKHLNALLRDGEHRVLNVAGFVPDAPLLVDLAEKAIGQIGSAMLMDANRETKKLIDQIAKPELRRVFLAGLPGEKTGEMLEVRVDDLFNFITDEFLPHVTETDNGFISIVGRLNEEIILRALRNSKLKDGVDFQRSGTNSVGDIIVSQRGGQKNNLYVEVKSYHARERLLRGLQDINHPFKVGIGYFRDPREFNPKRTQTLIDSGANAIYLPADTYGNVDPAALAMTTGKQSSFYRPMDRFVEDMVIFAENGAIGDYKFKS